MEIPNYPSNNDDVKQSSNKNKVELKGESRPPKKGFLKTVIDSYYGRSDKSDNLGGQIIGILIPDIKKSLLSIIELLIFPERRGTSRRDVSSDSSSVIRRYSQYYSERPSEVYNVGYNVTYKEFREYDDVKQILDSLLFDLKEYGFVTVANYYETSGMISKNHMDNKYGWYDLSKVKPERTSDGWWYLPMPKPVPSD